MKLSSTLLVYLFFNLQFLNAQTETTGTIILDSNMSVKLDKDIPNSQITIILTGPADRWFSIGLNAQLMLTNTDCLVMTSDTQFSDMFLPGGHLAPNFDTTNDWSVSSNTVNNTIRTIIATRSFSTGDNHDMIFTNLTNDLNFIWAYSSTPTYTLFSHGADNYGGGVFVFSNLGITDAKKNKIEIFPNPVNDLLNITTNSTDFTFISISDCMGKVIYTKSIFSKDYSINVSEFSKGMYFIKLKTDEKIDVLKFIKN